MDKPIYFPSLSEDGWIIDSKMQADYLFSHFFLSDYSQTQLYLKQVSSLSWVIQEGNKNITKTTSDLKETLAIYFGRYFKEVEVEVRDANFDPNNVRAELTLYVKFNDNEGNEVILGKLIHLLNAKITKVVNLSNGDNQ